MKSAPEFVKELEYFHFGEISLHRIDFEDKIANYCAATGVHFEYRDYWDKDEEIFQNAHNITALRKRFKQNIMTIGGKGKSIEKQRKKEEEAAKKMEEKNYFLL